MNSVELRDKKAQLKKDAFEILEKCKTEIQDLSEEENEKISSIKTEITNINEELRELEKELDSPEITNKKEKHMNKEFRLIETINAIANNRNLDEAQSAVVNKGAEEMRKAGLSFGGQIQLPVSESRSAITVANEGEDVVETEFTNILEPLRAKNVLLQAGAKYLGGLVGDVQIPVMAASNVTWEGETADAQDGAGTFSHVKLSPKRLTAYVDVSKQFLVQDSLDAENMIKNDIVNAINSKLEATILGTASGTTTTPEGIFYPTTAATSVNAFSGLTALESDVEDANVLGECVYVMSNKAKAKFRNMSKSTKSTELVMEGGEIDGTKCYNTSNISGNYFAYGDFSNLVIGQWGAIDLTIDPYTKAAAGQVRIVVNAFFDAKIVRSGAIKTGVAA